MKGVDIRVVTVWGLAFGQTIAVVCVFSFAPFFVEWMLTSELEGGNLPSTSQINLYTGLLMASAPGGMAASSAVWGWLSDHLGRRWALIIGVGFNSIGTLPFGMIKQVWLAIGLQFVLGLLNGNWGIMVTYLEEVLQSQGKQARERGFAIFMMMYGAGSVLGPSLGGFLSQPADKYSWMDCHFLRAYPYALPYCVSGVISFASWLLVVLFLKETLKKPGTYLAIPDDTVDATAAGEGQTTTSDKKKIESGGAVTQAPMETDVDVVHGKISEIHNQSLQKAKRKSKKKKPELKRSQSKLIVLLKTRDYIIATALFTTASFMFSSYETFYPLWARLDRSQNGTGWNTSQIGTVFLVCGIVITADNLAIFPCLVRWVDPTQIVRYSFFLNFVVLFLLYPYWLDSTAIDKSTVSSSYWYIPVIVCNGLLAMATGLLFTSVTILIQNGVPSNDMLGLANGFSQSLVAGVRCLAPLVAQAVFTWGLVLQEQIDPHYKNTYFHAKDMVFYFYGLIVLVSFLLTYALPETHSKAERLQLIEETPVVLSSVLGMSPMPVTPAIVVDWMDLHHNELVAEELELRMQSKHEQRAAAVADIEAQTLLANSQTNDYLAVNS